MRGLGWLFEDGCISESCTNNEAGKVMGVFKETVSCYGLPSCLWCDRDRENTEVAWYMHPNILLRQSEPLSHLAVVVLHNMKLFSIISMH